jgi:hypothetical protein
VCVFGSHFHPALVGLLRVHLFIFCVLLSEQMSGVAVVNEREIQPMNLSLDQLSQLKTQHEDELQVCLRFGASPLVRHSIIY